MTHTSCVLVLCIAIFGPGVLFMLWWVVKHLRGGTEGNAGMRGFAVSSTERPEPPRPISGDTQDAIPKNVREQLRREQQTWTR